MNEIYEKVGLTEQSFISFPINSAAVRELVEVEDFRPYSLKNLPHPFLSKSSSLMASFVNAERGDNTEYLFLISEDYEKCIVLQSYGDSISIDFFDTKMLPTQYPFDKRKIYEYSNRENERNIDFMFLLKRFFINILKENPEISVVVETYDYRRFCLLLSFMKRHSLEKRITLSYVGKVGY